MGNTENADQKQEIMTGKEYRSIFWRSFTIQSSWSFDKMMAYGYMYAIEKPLRKIYPNDDDYYAALKRHTETFNITPHVSPFLMGLGVAMEEQNAKSEDFDAESVNNVKVGLMGPLSGIGDSFFWGTFRVIAAGIGIGIAQSGSILGALVYFLIYTAIHFITKILAGKYGYKLGASFLENASENHTMEKLSYGASILGMTVIGAMVATMVSLQTTLSFTLAETETTLQSIFDQIFPGLLPLGVTFLCVFSGKGHPELCQRLSRGGDCLFCYSLFVLQRLHIPKMIHKGMLTGQSDPAGHKSIIDHRRLSVEGKAGVRFLMADAVESPHKIQMPGSAAELAVSNNMVSGRFLLRHQFGNALILHSFELIGGNGSCFIIGAGLFQFCRTKKAAHVVVTERCV